MARRAGLAAILICLVSVPLTLLAQTQRPMTINDLIGAVRVGDIQLSPDGRRVLFVRTTTDVDSGKRNADILMVPTDGSTAPLPLITGDKAENSPRFSPDGKKILFISTRSGEPQVFSADIDGKNVQQLTNLSGGVQPPLVISPDSKKFAFVSDVYTQCTDEDCNKRMRQAEEKDPVKVRVITGLPFRHWDEWRTNVRHHIFVSNFDSPQPHDITPGDFDSPTHFYEDNAITFSPDSRSIAFVSNRDGRDREMLDTNRDVWVVPLTGGDAKKVTSNPAADDQPTFSPDGKLLAIRSQRRAGFESDRWYVDLYDQSTGTKRTLFETPDLSVEDFSFSPNGRSIWFTAQDKGLVNLYVIPVSGGTPRLVVTGGAVSQFRPGTDFAIYSKSTLTSPPDLFRTASEGGSTQVQLTRENASWLAQIDSPKPETLTVPGAGGTPIQYWMLKPPNFEPSKKYAVVFLLHGGPQGAWEDGWSYRWNPMLWAAQGWIIAAPNPRGSFGFGQKFVDEISQDWCGKAMSDLNAVFDTVTKLPYVDPQRTAIAGASYGGYAVDWLIGHTNRFKAAVTHDGVFNLETVSLESEELWFTDWESGGPPWSAAARRHFDRCSPHLSADKIRTPTLIITNQQDFRVPVDQGLQLFTALRRNGVPSEALSFPDEGHWVLGALNSKRWHETVFAWLKKYLGT